MKIHNEYEEVFYNKEMYFSFSSMNRLMYNPESFYNHYIKNQKEDLVGKHLIKGRATHALLLENDKFKDQFLVTEEKLPGSSVIKIIDKMFYTGKPEGELKDQKDFIISWLVENNLYQSLTDDKPEKKNSRTGNEKRLDKVIDEISTRYYNFKKESEGRTVIDNELYEECNLAVSKIKESPYVKSLCLTEETNDMLIVSNEKMLYCKLSNYKFGLKGIIDNFVISYMDEKVTINDFKTSGKPLSGFDKSVESFNYSIQAAVYKRLVLANYPDAKDFEFEFNFLVIDNLNHVYSFRVTDETMERWNVELDDYLVKANYHYINNEYKLPYAFANNNVTL